MSDLVFGAHPRGDEASPGPWHLDGHNLSAVIRCTAERGSPEAKHLCGDYETIARCEGAGWAANARLISAAPDLLAALRACQSALAMMIAPDAIRQTTVINAFAAATAAEAMARTAIARARLADATNNKPQEPS